MCVFCVNRPYTIVMRISSLGFINNAGCFRNIHPSRTYWLTMIQELQSEDVCNSLPEFIKFRGPHFVLIPAVKHYDWDNEKFFWPIWGLVLIWTFKGIYCLTIEDLFLLICFCSEGRTSSNLGVIKCTRKRLADSIISLHLFSKWMWTTSPWMSPLRNVSLF